MLICKRNLTKIGKVILLPKDKMKITEDEQLWKLKKNIQRNRKQRIQNEGGNKNSKRKKIEYRNNSVSTKIRGKKKKRESC